MTRTKKNIVILSLIMCLFAMVCAATVTFKGEKVSAAELPQVQAKDFVVNNFFTQADQNRSVMYLQYIGGESGIGGGISATEGGGWPLFKVKKTDGNVENMYFGGWQESAVYSIFALPLDMSSWEEFTMPAGTYSGVELVDDLVVRHAGDSWWVASSYKNTDFSVSFSGKDNDNNSCIYITKKGSFNLIPGGWYTFKNQAQKFIAKTADGTEEEIYANYLQLDANTIYIKFANGALDKYTELTLPEGAYQLSDDLYRYFESGFTFYKSSNGSWKTERQSFTLSFKSVTTDIAASIEGWTNNGTGTQGITANGGEIQADFNSATTANYCNNDVFSSVANADYTIRYEHKSIGTETGASYHLFDSGWKEVKTWLWATTDWSVQEIAYTAKFDNDTLIFQSVGNNKVVLFRNFTITRNYESKSFSGGESIGELPEIPAKEGYRGYWAIDGAEITAETAYNYGEDKTAVLVYEKSAVQYSLTFSERQNLSDSANDWDIAGNKEGITCSEGILSIDYSNSEGTEISAIRKNLTGLVAGETYTVSLDYKGPKGGVDFHLYIGEKNVKAWLWAVDTDWTHFTAEVTFDGNNYAILKWVGTTKYLQVKNFVIDKKITERTVTEGTTIGELPAITEKIGYRGYWAIDGAEITAETAYNYGENKTAVLVYEEITKINDVSISLNGNIALNFYVSVADENMKAFFTVDGVKTEANGFTLANGNQRVYTYALAAKEYEKGITLTIGEGEGAVSSTTSIKAYIDAAKNIFTGELKDLIEALEVYCDSAAKYFAGEAVDTIIPNGDELDKYAARKEGTLPEGVTVTGISVILESTVSIHVYLGGANVENATYAIDGVPAELHMLSEGIYYLEKAHIAAKDLNRSYDFAIGDCVISCSALSYAHIAINGEATTDENLKNLLKAMYNYSIAADGYFMDTATASTDMGKSIVYANKIENGVQGKHVDNDKTAYTVNNDRISLTHGLKPRGSMLVSSLTSVNGGEYLKNTMDVFLNKTVNGTESETYASNSTDIARSGFSATACAPYVNVNKLGYYYYQVNVRNLNFGDNLYLDKTYHVYSDKIYQEYRLLNRGTGAAALNFIAFEAIFPVASVTKFEISDGNEVTTSFEGSYKIIENPQYAAFDIAGVGVIGFINTTNSDFVIINNEGNYYFRQRHYISDLAANAETAFGSRIYTDETHDFAGVRAANYEEQNPLTAAEISVTGDGASFVGYDNLRGYYVCRIDGCYFSAAHENPDKKYIDKISVCSTDARKIFFCVNSDYPLEGAAITDDKDMLMPIGTQVVKNFSHEHEEPVYDPDDKMYGDTIFPIVTQKSKTLSFSVVNVYENWGNYLAKQLSSISYYVAYYHLSTGVRETNCIAPYYATYLNKQELGSWILPDFRGASCDGQYKEDGTTDPLQRNSVGAMNGLSNGTGQSAEEADLGIYQGSEILSAGLTYADLKYSYISKNGDYKYTYRHVEMPQTDESRTYYTIEMEFLKETTLYSSSFSFFSFDTRIGSDTFASAAYLDESGKEQTITIDGDKLASTSSVINKWSDTRYKLHKGGSYFTFFNGNGAAEFGNFGLIVKNSTWIADGNVNELDLAFYNSRILRENKYVNRGSLTVGEDWKFPAGAKVTLDVILLPYGARTEQTDCTNVRKVYEDSVTNALSVTAQNGRVINDSFIPTVKAYGNEVVFTLKGGVAQNDSEGVIYAIKAEGFQKLGKLKVEKLNASGEWETVELASESSFDGYGVQYCGERANYSFVITKTAADATYRVTVL